MQIIFYLTLCTGIIGKRKTSFTRSSRYKSLEKITLVCKQNTKTDNTFSLFCSSRKCFLRFSQEDSQKLLQLSSKGPTELHLSLAADLDGIHQVLGLEACKMQEQGDLRPGFRKPRCQSPFLCMESPDELCVKLER